MPALVAPKFSKDILLVVGSEDNRTPQWMSEKIYNALPAESIRNFLYMRVPVTEALSSLSLLIGSDGLRRQWDLCWISP